MAVAPLYFPGSNGSVSYSGPSSVCRTWTVTELPPTAIAMSARSAISEADGKTVSTSSVTGGGRSGASEKNLPITAGSGFPS